MAKVDSKKESAGTKCPGCGKDDWKEGEDGALTCVECGYKVGSKGKKELEPLESDLEEVKSAVKEAIFDMRKEIQAMVEAPVPSVPSPGAGMGHNAIMCPECSDCDCEIIRQDGSTNIFWCRHCGREFSNDTLNWAMPKPESNPSRATGRGVGQSQEEMPR